MPMWDKLFKKKDDAPNKLNPIVQKNPMPVASPRISSARPAEPAPKVEIRAPKPEPAAKKPEPPAKKPEETKSRRPSDAESFLKRGLTRQAHREHDGAIEDFSKAIELDGNLAKAYAARGVSREAKGDGAGAKSDYSKSIQIEIMNEIGRQMRENPDVEV